jgi:hypothetical protein
MRYLLLVLLPLFLGGCFITTNSAPPPPPATNTVVLPSGTNAVCSNGSAPPC